MRRPEHRREVAEFVRDMYSISNCNTWDQFAKKASVLPEQVSDWQRGENIPDGYNLLKLIRASGVLVPPASEGPAVIDGIIKLIDAIETSPSLARVLEPSLRQVVQEIHALGVASSSAADRLSELLDAHNVPEGPGDAR